LEVSRKQKLSDKSKKNIYNTHPNNKAKSIFKYHLKTTNNNTFSLVNHEKKAVTLELDHD